MMWKTDGLSHTYVSFVYFGWWVREGVRSLIETGTAVFPVWDLSIGMGRDLFEVSALPFQNPLYLISVFIPSKFAEWGYDAVIVVQLYLSGLAFACFTRRQGISRFPTLVGSLSYAFSGWMLCVADQFGFIKPMILFPLLLISAEAVFQRKSPLPFIAMSAIFLIVGGYYFSYIAFIALAFYCAALFWKYSDKHTIGSFVKWVVIMLTYVLVAALISCVFLLPAVSSVAGQRRLSLDYYIPMFFTPAFYTQLISGFMGFAEFNGNSEFAVGCLGFVSCLLLFRRSGTRGLRVALIVLLVCLFVPYASSVLNGFKYASFRWLWVFTLLLCYIIAKMTPEIMAIKLKDMRLLCLGTVVIGCIVFVFPNARNDAAIAGFCLLLVLLALLFGMIALERKGRILSRNIKRALIIIVALGCVFVPFHYYLVGDRAAIQGEVPFGTAWLQHTDGSISSVVKQVDDNGLWRYDYYGVSRLRNNSQLTHLNSFDAYTSSYDKLVDAFFTDLEVSDNQSSQILLNLTRRSFLEVALGAKYFVVGAAPEKNDRDDATPEVRNLPYGTGDEPIVSGAIQSSGGKKNEIFVYENELALPLAYTFSKAIDIEDYKRLTAVQKQQAVLQVVAVRGLDEYKTNPSSLLFDDRPIDYEISATNNVVVDDGRFLVKKKGGNITLNVDCEIPGELYVEFVNLTFENIPPTLKQNASVDDWVNYLRKCYKWEHLRSYSLKVTTDDLQSVNLSNSTKYNHMYGGDDSNIINLGYRVDPTHEITITFNNAGAYSYDDLNVIVQPVEHLDEYVSDRRTYPVDLTQGVDAFSAHVVNDDDQILFLSIPWSEGWSAAVDGQTAEIYLANDAFMAVELPPGRHDVEFKYESPRLKRGVALTLVGLVAAGALVAIRRHRLRRDASTVTVKE